MGAGLLVLLVAAGAQAQTQGALAQGALPTVDQVLARYVTGLGGRAAIQKLTSRVAKGTLEVPEQGVNGTVTLQSKAPSKRRFTIDIERYGLVEQSFNGMAGWADNPETGLRDLSEEELGYERLATDFYAALNIGKSYTGLTVKGKEKMGESDVSLVEGKQPDGFLRVMYFDAATGLLVRFSAERGGPGGAIQGDNYLEDYRAGCNRSARASPGRSAPRCCS
jgi:hypothetical protein